jgi:membrane protease YdiL (CAAX protease family)
LLIGTLYLDTDLVSLAEMLSNPEKNEIIGFTKFYQLLNQLGIFIVSVFLYLYLVSNSSLDYLKVNKAPLTISVLVAMVIVFTILPFLNYISEFNQALSLPSSMEGLENWMLEKEVQAKVLTEAFLKTDSISGLLVNIFIVALVPALGEEFLFRGVMLRLFKEMFKNIHIAIFISAFIFSLFHMQFYGFLPRFFLGMVLGYLFVYTGNLWVPIAFHFVNNAASVIVYFLYQNGHIVTNVDNFGASSNVVYVIASLLISIWLIIIIRQRENYDLFKEL